MEDPKQPTNQELLDIIVKLGHTLEANLQRSIDEILDHLTTFHPVRTTLTPQKAKNSRQFTTVEQARQVKGFMVHFRMQQQKIAEILGMSGGAVSNVLKGVGRAALGAEPASLEECLSLLKQYDVDKSRAKQ